MEKQMGCLWAMGYMWEVKRAVVGNCMQQQSFANRSLIYRVHQTTQACFWHSLTLKQMQLPSGNCTVTAFQLFARTKCIICFSIAAQHRMRAHTQTWKRVLFMYVRYNVSPVNTDYKIAKLQMTSSKQIVVFTYSTKVTSWNHNFVNLSHRLVLMCLYHYIFMLQLMGKSWLKSAISYKPLFGSASINVTP